MVAIIEAFLGLLCMLHSLLHIRNQLLHFGGKVFAVGSIVESLARRRSIGRGMFSPYKTSNGALLILAFMVALIAISVTAT